MAQTDKRDERTAEPPRISGRKVVAVMIGFGLLMVAALFIYWELYTGPFRPLQTAIAAEFPGSRPGVVGGRHKFNQPGNPETLRIVIWVDFDGNADPEKAHGYSRRLAALANQYVDLSQYEDLEIRLIERVGDSDSRMWVDSRPINKWNIESATPTPPSAR